MRRIIHSLILSLLGLLLADLFVSLRELPWRGIVVFYLLGTAYAYFLFIPSLLQELDRAEALRKKLEDH